MRPRITGIAVISLFGLLALSACAGSAASATPGAPAIPITASDSVALAFNPADASLLLADQSGLSRWQAGKWESLPVPNTYGMSGIVVNPDHPATVYASGPGLGVIRSDDGGATWKDDNTGLPGLDVTALALHSFRRETLYAWLKGDGVYRTEDGGAQWVKMPDQGPPDTDVRDLTHSTLPGSMNTGWLYAATPSGAYLSMDCF